MLPMLSAFTDSAQTFFGASVLSSTSAANRYLQESSGLWETSDRDAALDVDSD